MTSEKWDKPYIVLNLLRDIARKQHVFMWNVLGPESGNLNYSGYCTSLEFFLRHYVTGRNVILFAHSDDHLNNNLYQRASDIDANEPITTKRDLVDFLRNKNKANTIAVFACICGDTAQQSGADCGIKWQASGFDAVQCLRTFELLRDIGVCKQFHQASLRVFASYFQGVYPYGRGGFGHEFEFFDEAFDLLKNDADNEKYNTTFRQAIDLYLTDFYQFSKSRFCCSNRGIDMAQVMDQADYEDALTFLATLIAKYKSEENTAELENLRRQAIRTLKYRLHLDQDASEAEIDDSLSKLEQSSLQHRQAKAWQRIINTVSQI